VEQRSPDLGRSPEARPVLVGAPHVPGVAASMFGGIVVSDPVRTGADVDHFVTIRRENI
jgi:hypothetical protein